MKKIILALLILLALAIGSVYLFVPSQLTVTDYTMIPGTADAISRSLLFQNNWVKFWDGEKRTGSNLMVNETDHFIRNGDTLTITELLHNAIKIQVAGKKSRQETLLTIIPADKTSAILNWTYTTTASNNPFLRVMQYFDAVDKKKTMSHTLDLMKTYFSRPENIYGILIEETSTVDTMLISTARYLSHYPTVADIYSTIDNLNLYAKNNGASVVSYPYLNITSLDSQQYQMMVALPVNKSLPAKDDITYKKMIPGNFMTATVKGGEGNIRNAYNNMALYFTDYKRIGMAIPFQVLIVNRKETPDTSRWITKIYFPVM